MINLLESIDFYLQKGYEDAYATAKVAQDIILSKIAKSNYRNNITVKGGVVMFNITKDKRRATVDIDIDLIRYSLEDKSILLLFDKLNQIDDGIKIIVNKKIKPLRFKDIYDFYYLITEGNMEKSLLIKLINIYCINNISRINTTSDIVNELSRIFNNPNFLENVQNSRYNWIGENTNIVLNTILDFIKQLEPLVV